MKQSMVALGLCFSLFGQGRIEGPVVGWVWDGGGARAILGIPGASLLGESLTPVIALTHAVVASNGDYVMATGAGDSRVYLMSTRTGALREIEGVLPGADEIVLSPGGRSALLHYRAGSRIGILTGLPEQPRQAAVLDISVEGSPDALAVTDDAAVVVAAYRENRLLMAFDSEGNRWKLPYAGSARQVSFVDGRRDALVADASGLWLVNDVAGNVDARLLWEGDALRAASTSDRRHAVAVDGADDTLVILSLESGAVRRIGTDFKPSTLTRLSENVFRIRDFDAGPLWILDLADGEPRVLFVPADANIEKND